MQGDSDEGEGEGSQGLTYYSVIISIMTSTVTENLQIRKKLDKFMDKMARKTKFSESEIERLVHIYNRITV